MSFSLILLSKTILSLSHEYCRANHSNFNINAEKNDFAGLDFAALDGLAGYIAEEEEALEDVQVGQCQSVPELSEAERGDTTTGSEAPPIV